VNMLRVEARIPEVAGPMLIPISSSRESNKALTLPYPAPQIASLPADQQQALLGGQLPA